MIGKFFAHIELTAWPVISMVMFMLFFIGIVAWTFRPQAKYSYEDAAHLPLEDGDMDAKDLNGDTV